MKTTHFCLLLMMCRMGVVPLLAEETPQPDPTFVDETASQTATNSQEIQLQAISATGLSGEIGQVFHVKCSKRVKSVDDFDPELIEVKVVQGDPAALQVRLLQAGASGLLVTDELGQTTHLEIVVTEDDRGLGVILQRLYPGSQIDTVPIQGSVLLRGNVDSSRCRDQIVEIAEQFYPTILDQLQVTASSGQGAKPRSDGQKSASGSLQQRRFRITDRETTLSVPEGRSLTLEMPARVQQSQSSSRRDDVFEFVNDDHKQVRFTPREGLTKCWFMCADGVRYSVTVYAAHDVSQFVHYVRRLYPNLQLELIPVNSVVVMRGVVQTEQQAQQLLEIAGQFFPQVINQLEPATISGLSGFESPSAAAVPAQPGPEAAAELRQSEIQSLRKDVRDLHTEVRTLIKMLQETPAELRIQKILRGAVSLHFHDTPLTEIVRHIASTHQLNVVLDGRVTDRTVSIDVDGVQLRSALNLLLGTEFVYLVEDEVLKITDDPRRAIEEADSDRIESVPERFADERQTETEAAGDVNAAATDPGTRLLFFTAAWCGPCQEMEPIVRNLMDTFSTIERIDIARQPDIVRAYNVTSIPTFIRVHNETVLQRIRGKTTEEQLRELLTTSAVPTPAAVDEL